jgi:hypothetical protein
MIGRKILLLAGILYATAVLCALLPSIAPAGHNADATTEPPITGLANLTGLKPYCAIALQLQRVDWVDKYKKTIDEIAAEGADTVSLVVDARQEDSTSTFIYIDMRKTLTEPQLLDIINHAKSKHLRVILMPIVLLDNGNDSHWRGTLAPVDRFASDHASTLPDGWAAWFDSYRDMMTHYATIAQQGNVDVLVVGSELVSAEEQIDEWVKTIKLVRGIFKGQLTYSSNWDRYRKVKFWKYLDLVGMNSYWTLGIDEKVAPAVIASNWANIQRDMFDFLAEVHKPVILLEAGWCSLSNAAKDPWDYTQTQLDADPDLQRRLYEGFFQAWWNKPQLAGFCIWSFNPDGDDTGKGYSPQGKPAEDVIRDWLSKPRWDVQSN